MQKCTIIDTLRKPKIFNIAIFDLSLTILIIYFIAYKSYSKIQNKLSFISYLIILEIVGLTLGIIVHKVLGINTMLNYYLGLNPKPIRTECI